MKVLLSVLHFGLLRNFESVVRTLAEKGHEVLLLADEDDSFGGERLAQDLASIPKVRHYRAPSYADETWFPVARKLRQGLDYLRFLDLRYAPFPKLRERAAERAPRFVTILMHLPPLRVAGVRQLLSNTLSAVERGMPRLEAMDTLLSRERPDVALFGSVTHPRAAQLDHLRSARALGIPTGVCVYSWDHLSSKTKIRVLPDRLFVWNETQRREAVELHDMPIDRVVVTGAQVYDQWFDRKPSRNRKTFLSDIGLPLDQALILYVCSAMTPDPHEVNFVRRWVEAIRGSSHPQLCEASLLIRPHPERQREWNDVNWSDLDPLVIAGANPIQPSAKSDYFDALTHSTAVVGIVTSAFLEAAVVGRPVLTITPPEFRPHQNGMRHFRYLLEVEDGLLKVAQSLDQHVKHLETIFDGDTAHVRQQQRFLRAFIRPFGLDRAATPHFVESIETLAQSNSITTPTEASAWQKGLARCLIYSASLGLLGWAMQDAREVREERERRRQINEHRRARRLKWRRHRRRKLFTRLQSAISKASSVMKRIRSKRRMYVHRSLKLVLRLQMILRRRRRDVETR